VALDHLHEAGVVRVAREVDVDLVALDEGRLVGEHLRGLGPPGVLLGPVAVAPGRVLGLEPDHGDRLAGVGDPAGRAEPAGRAGSQLVGPPVHGRPQLVLVTDLALDDLHEHRDPPPPRGAGAPPWPRR
jgi:hypothetical protein